MFMSYAALINSLILHAVLDITPLLPCCYFERTRFDIISWTSSNKRAVYCHRKQQLYQHEHTTIRTICKANVSKVTVGGQSIHTTSDSPSHVFLAHIVASCKHEVETSCVAQCLLGATSSTLTSRLCNNRG
jgi:hypothetical protein